MPRRLPQTACLLILCLIFVHAAGCADSPPPPPPSPPPSAVPPPPAAAATTPPEADPVADAISTELLEGAAPAPAFPADLAWLNTDQPLTLDQYKGKFVLLDFWTYCCINCMHVIPELRNLEHKYPDSLVVIGVHSAKFTNEKTTAQIRKAILRYEIKHPVVNDADMAIWRAYQVNSWPTLVLINPEGKIVGQQSGEGNEALFDALLKKGVQHFTAKGTLKKSALNLKLEQAATDTPLSFPGKIAVGRTRATADRNSVPCLIVSDSNHNRIRLIDPANGKILDTIGSGAIGRADGAFAAASFDHPQGVTQVGDMLYIADTENHLIRAADLNTRTVKTFLGTGAKATRFNVPGTGSQCPINSPWDLTAHAGKLYIAMAGFHQIWVADLQSAATQPYIGTGREQIADGLRREAALAQPSGLTVVDTILYWADSETSSIRMAPIAAAADSQVTTLIGAGLFDYGDVDGDQAVARLQHPLGLVHHDGKLYVADTYNAKIKMIDPQLRTSATLAGQRQAGLRDGPAATAQFNEPGGVAILGDTLYIADTNNHRIRTLDLKTNAVATLALTEQTERAE